MKYLLMAIVSLLSISEVSAEKVNSSILILNKDTFFLIKDRDTIFAEKRDSIFYLAGTKNLVISKIVLPNTVKKAFKVATTNNTIVSDSISGKYSKPLKISSGQYSIQWGNLKWTICITEDGVVEGKKDILSGAWLIAFGTLIGIMLSIVCLIIFIYRKSIKSRLEIWISTIEFDICSKKTKTDDGITLKCVGRKEAFMNGAKACPDGYHTFNKGKSAVLVENGKIKLVFLNGSILLKSDEETKVAIIKNENADTCEIGNTAYPDGYHTFDKGKSALSAVLIKDGKIELCFPKKKSKLYPSDEGKEVRINIHGSKYEVGDMAYPDGFHTFNKDKWALLVEGGKIKLIFPEKGALILLSDERKIGIIKNENGDTYKVGNIAYPDGEHIISDKIIKIVDGKISEITNKATLKQPKPNEPEYELSGPWYSLLSDDVKMAINAFCSNVETFETFETFETWVDFINFISQKFTLQKPVEPSSPTEGCIIDALIKEMSQESNILKSLEKYKREIANRKDLIDFVNYLSESYTLEYLKRLAKTHYPNIDETLRLEVFDKYVIKRLGFKLGWNDDIKDLSKAINELNIPTQEDYEDYVIKKINALIGKDGKEFSKWDEFAIEWRNINKELRILQSLAEKKNKTIEVFLRELKEDNPNPDNSEIQIAGRTIEEAEIDLNTYDKLKSLSEFGGTDEEIKSSIVRETKNSLLNSIKDAYKSVFDETLELDDFDEAINNKFAQKVEETKQSAKKAGVQTVIDTIANAVGNIAIDEKNKAYNNLSNLVGKIRKADSVEKMKNAMMLIRNVADDLKNLIEEKECAKQEKQNVEKSILVAVKDKYKTIFEEEVAISKTPIDSIITFADKAQNKLSQMEMEIAQKDNKIEQLFNVYSHIVIGTLEKTKENLDKVCENARKSEALSDRFIKRVLQNDAFNVGDFMKEAQEDILNNEQNIKESNEDEIKKSLHNLFLSAVQGNSWLQTLSCIYLYVQHPKVAESFVKKGVNVGCINVSFILTEHIMRLLDIKLSYPKLFEDTFDGNLYDEATLSDVNDYIDNVIELVGDRHGVIIDMHRLGYTADGETVKAQVVRFN